MGRRKKPGFADMKMMAARVEGADYDKFEYILKNRDGKNLQEAVNMFVREFISGNLCFSGTHIVEKRL
jgi:hypothetical protein